VSQIPKSRLFDRTTEHSKAEARVSRAKAVKDENEAERLVFDERTSRPRSMRLARENARSGWAAGEATDVRLDSCEGANTSPLPSTPRAKSYLR
jgi:hypothetical protein